MKLFTNNLILVACCLTMLPSLALAERYLIKFNSDQTFKSYSAQVDNQKQLLGSYVNGPVRSGVQFMNSEAQVTNALNALEMVVIEIDGEMDSEMLSQHPSIQFIEKEYMIPAPQPVNVFSTYSSASSALTLDDFDTPWGLVAVNAEGAWDLNGEGEGARVMVLDTGVDKDHPALVDQFVEGADFTNSRGLPYDYFDEAGHGTHVAGTVLGANVGVAPEAELYVGKVCVAAGCPSISIVEGVNWAIEQEVDVVNMSLGGPFPSNRAVYEAAEAADVLIVAASGNDGKQGIGYPAGHPTTFAVGAIDSNMEKAEFSQWGAGLDLVAPGVEVLSSVPLGTGRVSEALVDLGDGLETVLSGAMDGSALMEEPLVGSTIYAGLGKPEDFQGKNVAGKIALISRGEIPFGDKAMAAFQAGAAGVIIFNNEPGMTRGTLNAEMSIPVLMIEQAIGEEMAEADSVEVSIAVKASDYAELQGTSMATPHVSGVAALVRVANPELTASEVRALLKSTADELDGDNSENQLGAGNVNAEMAVEKALRARAAK